MANKLSKDQIEKKKKFHEKRVIFYSKKLTEAKKDESRIGFKWYD